MSCGTALSRVLGSGQCWSATQWHASPRHVSALTNDTATFRQRHNVGALGSRPLGENQFCLFSGRSGNARHRDHERSLVFESTLPMAHDRVFWALSRRQEGGDFITEVVVAAGESALVPDFQLGLSKQTIVGSIHCHLVSRPSPKTPVLASRPGAYSSRCSCTPPIIFRRPVENGVVHGAICAQQCSLPPHDTDSSLSVGLNCHDTATRGA